MPVEWSGLGPELLVRLDRERAEPLGAQLQRELRAAIRAGRLQPGERLPSSRELARELGVSRGLVSECYVQLRAEGYLSARSGSATRVAAGAHEQPAEEAPAAPSARLAVDFRPGIPDLAGFPRRDWMWALREALRDAPADALGYGDRRGSPELRRVISAYLGRVRGAHADPDRIVICNGYTQGLNLVLRVLARSGVRRFAFEDPSMGGYPANAARAGAEAVPVPVDARGIDVAALAATGVRAVVLTPAHQAPTGVVLAPERRHALLAWAAERDAVVVEDDYDAEFRYDREPVGALQGLAPDRVVATSSVSKTIGPALRLGWIVCPPRLAAAIAEEKEREDHGSPGLDQLALALLIESGRYDRQLRRMRAVYAARRRALADALARHAPGVELTGLAAGFHAVLRLPDGADETAVVAAAAERSVGLYGMSRYRADGATDPPVLVLGYGNVAAPAVERGIAAVGDLLRPRAGGRRPGVSRARTAGTA
jgi:GntR family transcriptional regulator/MocR family aminotransferase